MVASYGSIADDGASKRSQLTDLYEEAAVLASETTKPLTNKPNQHAPQKGVHLYQFPASFYSCEARLVLEEKGVDYTEHDICIIAGVFDQYEPEYVRLNPRCVVPTLCIDGKVTSDAHNIVLHADDFFPQAVKLFPDDDNKDIVKEQFDLACSVYVEALTYGEAPGGPKLPWHMRGMMKSNHGKKYNMLKKKLHEHRNDPYLKACYEGKLAILTKQIEILDSEKQLSDIVNATKIIMKQLNKSVIEGPAKDGGWLCGENYTIADMQWGLTLARLHMREYSDLLWGDYPAIEAYCQKLMARPAIQKAVVQYQTTSKIGGLVLRRRVAQSSKKIALLVAAAALIGIALNRK